MRQLKSVKGWLVVACLSGTLVGCSGYGRPTITPESPELGAISGTGVTLDVALKVDNPNPFALVAKKLSGTLLLGSGEGKRVGTAEVEFEHPIAAKASETIHSNLEIAWTSVSALGQFLSESSVPYTFAGELAVGGGPLKLSVPFKLRGEIAREDLAKVGVEGLKSLKGLLP